MTAEGAAASRIRASTRPLAECHDLAVLDLDGVVYVGRDAVPGAAEAIGAARAAGMAVCYLTNNASRPARTVADHLGELGVPATPDDVLTSAQVGAALLAQRLPRGARVLVVGGEGLEVALAEVGLVPVAGMDQGPDAVAQGFDPDIGWRLLAEGTRAVRAGLLWLATNLDLTVPTPHGPAPGNGSLVNLVATAAGRPPDLVAGKPRPEPFLDAVRRHGSTTPLVIGDRLDTDLQGAHAAGIPSLAVMTGVGGVHDLVTAPPEQRPHYLAADLSGLLHPHPSVDVRAGEGVSARCRGATVALDDLAPARGGPSLRVPQPGDDPVDLLRAACGAAWAWADLRAGERADSAPVEVATHEVASACGRFEAATAWAR